MNSEATKLSEEQEDKLLAVVIITCGSSPWIAILLIVHCGSAISIACLAVVFAFFFGCAARIVCEMDHAENEVNPRES